MSTWDELKKKSLDALIRMAIDGDADEVQTGAVADDVLTQLWSAWESGEEWAEVEIRKRCREGIRIRVRRFVKGARGTVRISGSGQVIDMPTYVGIEMKNGRKHHQLALWYELDWKSFASMVRNRARQRRILSRELTAFNEIMGLHDRYPDSHTPAEACKLAGIDPKSFDLESELEA